MITIKYITRAYYGITRVWLDRYTHIPNSYTRNGISCGNTVISIYTTPSKVKGLFLSLLVEID